ncbi:hypothetical protein PMAYCL1PPCAC_01836, partial [Pristionchus mayeri]
VECCEAMLANNDACYLIMKMQMVLRVNVVNVVFPVLWPPWNLKHHFAIVARAYLSAVFRILCPFTLLCCFIECMVFD